MKNDSQVAEIDFSAISSQYRIIVNSGWFDYLIFTVLVVLLSILILSLVSKKIRSRSNAKVFIGMAGIIFFTSFNLYGHHALSIFFSAETKAPELLFSLAAAFAWMSCAMVLNALLNFFLWSSSGKSDAASRPHKLLTGLISLALYALFFLVVMHVVFGQAIAALALVWSGALFGIAYVAAPTLSEIFAGIALSISPPFKRGDEIIVQGQKGIVTDLNWHSVILSDDDAEISIANSEVAKSVIINLTRTPDRSYSIEVPLTYGASPLYVKNMLVQAALEVEGVRKAKVRIKDINMHGVNYKVVFFIEANASENLVTDLIRQSIFYRVSKSGSLDFATTKKAHWDKSTLLTESLEHKIAVISKTDIFGILGADEIKLLAENLTVQLYGPPEAIVHQGESGDSMFIIASGRADVTVFVEENKSNLKVATKEAGQYFGEMTLLTGEPRSATVRATEDSVIYEIKKSTLSVLFSQRPELMDKLAEIVAALKEDALNKKEKMLASGGKESKKRLDTLVDALKNKMRAFFG